MKDLWIATERNSSAWRADRVTQLRLRALMHDRNQQQHGSFILGTITAFQHTSRGEIQTPSEVFQFQSNGSWRKSGSVSTGDLPMPFYGDRIYREGADFAVVNHEYGVGIALKEQLLVTCAPFIEPGRRDHARFQRFIDTVLPMVTQAAMSGELVEYTP